MKQHVFTFLVVLAAIAAFTYVVGPQIDKLVAGTATPDPGTPTAE